MTVFLFFTFLEHDLCSPTWLESHATFGTIKTHKHTNTSYNTPVPTQGTHVIPSDQKISTFTFAGLLWLQSEPLWLPSAYLNICVRVYFCLVCEVHRKSYLLVRALLVKLGWSEGIQTKHWQKILRRYNRFVFLIFNLALLLSGYW